MKHAVAVALNGSLRSTRINIPKPKTSAISATLPKLFVSSKLLNFSFTERGINLQLLQNEKAQSLPFPPSKPSALPFYFSLSSSSSNVTPSHSNLQPEISSSVVVVAVSVSFLALACSIASRFGNEQRRLFYDAAD